ncbi:unnamed protein product [Cercospora beticola]|nr:unnamed protein product [Cercospora beticola]
MCNNTTNYNNYPVATAYLTIPTAMDVERCPSCRRSIATCRCEAPVQPRRRDIFDSADAQSMGWDTCPACRQNISDCSCAVKNQFAIDSDTCPICRQNISDCCCAVKNKFAIDCAAKHITYMVDSAMKTSLLTLGAFPGQSMGWDTCPTCRQNISDCSCAVKNQFAISTLSDTCPICRQNISDCCCAVKNQFAISTLSDTCPICRQNISDCCCAVKNQFAIDCAAKHIAFMVDSAVKNQFATTVKADTCLDCGRAVDKCRCDAPVKPHRLSTAQNSHLAFREPLCQYR